MASRLNEGRRGREAEGAPWELGCWIPPRAAQLAPATCVAADSMFLWSARKARSSDSV